MISTKFKKKISIISILLLFFVLGILLFYQDKQLKNWVEIKGSVLKSALIFEIDNSSLIFNKLDDKSICKSLNCNFTNKELNNAHVKTIIDFFNRKMILEGNTVFKRYNASKQSFLYFDGNLTTNDNGTMIKFQIEGNFYIDFKKYGNNYICITSVINSDIFKYAIDKLNPFIIENLLESLQKKLMFNILKDISATNVSSYYDGYLPALL